MTIGHNRHKIILEQLGENMNKLIIASVMLSASATALAENYLTPADLSDDDTNAMYSHVMEYNRCMMLGRLNPEIEGKSGEEAANFIMQGCESHLDNLKAFLTAKNIEPGLVEGMNKKMRSRAARHLMTETMNNLAAQAQAYGNAEKVKAE
jgi:hypothetical protein